MEFVQSKNAGFAALTTGPDTFSHRVLHFCPIVIGIDLKTMVVMGGLEPPTPAL